MHAHTDTSGLEKLGFLVNKNLCSSKQVQENVVCLVIFCFLLCYKVKVIPSPCISLCTKSNRLWKENVEINLGTAIFSIFFSDSIITLENITTCFWKDCEYWFSNMLKIFIRKALSIQVVNLQLQIYKVTILGSGAFYSNC